MNATYDPDTTTPRGWSRSFEEPAYSGHPPTLEDLSTEARVRLVRFIVSATLERGSAPTAVISLYADLAGEPLAVRYADQRFALREMPGDWRDVENRVLDMEEDAHGRGVNLASAWRRAESVAVIGQEPLEQLSRLSGSRHGGSRPQRSIFDDPEDLDSLDEGQGYSSDLGLLVDRLPDLVDLSDEAQLRIRRYAVEERLEHGLPAVELLELYRVFEMGGDERARQYLDRVFVDHEPPEDWVETQAEASRMMDMASLRGQDAGRLFADILRGSPGLPPLVALQMIAERLQRLVR